MTFVWLFAINRKNRNLFLKLIIKSNLSQSQCLCIACLKDGNKIPKINSWEEKKESVIVFKTLEYINRIYLLYTMSLSCFACPHMCLPNCGKFECKFSKCISLLDPISEIYEKFCLYRYFENFKREWDGHVLGGLEISGKRDLNLRSENCIEVKVWKKLH